MSPADDSRDRLIALEVTVKHLSRQLSESEKKIDEMYALMMQGKGAWWIVVGASGFVGFLLSLMVKLIPWATTMPR